VHCLCVLLFVYCGTTGYESQDVVLYAGMNIFSFWVFSKDIKILDIFNQGQVWGDGGTLSVMRPGQNDLVMYTERQQCDAINANHLHARGNVSMNLQNFQDEMSMHTLSDAAPPITTACHIRLGTTRFYIPVVRGTISLELHANPAQPNTNKM